MKTESEIIDPWGVVVASLKSPLFAEGPCGLQPPTVRYSEFAPLARWKAYEGSIENAGEALGLVLWWDRKPVLMGIDRVARLLEVQPFRGDGLEARDLKIWMSSLLRKNGVERVVLLDERQAPILELTKEPK